VKEVELETEAKVPELAKVKRFGQILEVEKAEREEKQRVLGFLGLQEFLGFLEQLELARPKWWNLAAFLKEPLLAGLKEKLAEFQQLLQQVLGRARPLLKPETDRQEFGRRVWPRDHP